MATGDSPVTVASATGEMPVPTSTGLSGTDSESEPVKYASTCPTFTLAPGFAPAGAELGKAEEVITGLEDPQQLTLDAEGRFFVSDLGSSNQVKVFGPDGKRVGAIGAAWTPSVGP